MLTSVFAGVSAALIAVGTGSPGEPDKTSQLAVNETAAAPAATAKPAAETKICRRVESTGSRLEPRLCLTAKEWKRMTDE